MTAAEMLPAAMTRTEAEQVTTKIKLLVESVANTTEKIITLIEQAESGRAWQALEYPSWTAYVAAEFSEVLARLQRAERIPVVQKLSTTGMSTRAIAPVVGTSQKTIVTDLQAGDTAGITSGHFACGSDHCWHSPVCPRVPKNKQITGTDGKNYPRKATFLPDGRPDARSTQDMGESVPPPARKAPRRPLPDQYRSAVRDLEKVVARLEKLQGDDRFDPGKESYSWQLAALTAALKKLTAIVEPHVLATEHQVGGDPDD